MRSAHTQSLRENTTSRHRERRSPPYTPKPYEYGRVCGAKRFTDGSWAAAAAPARAGGVAGSGSARAGVRALRHREAVARRAYLGHLEANRDGGWADGRRRRRAHRQHVRRLRRLPRAQLARAVASQL
eukprot:4046538-Prymnesium_polylepis.1